MSKPITELDLVEIVEGEVGEPVEIETPTGTVTATWLGTVSNGKELSAAMKLMWDLAAEREAQAE
jgi:molybdopterin-binding protein